MQHNLHEGLKFYADLSRLLGELRDAVKDVSCPLPPFCDRFARGSFPRSIARLKVAVVYADNDPPLPPSCSLSRHEKPTRMRGCCRFRRRNQHSQPPSSPPTLHHLPPVRPERDLPRLLLLLSLLLHVGLPLREGGRPDNRARSTTTMEIRLRRQSRLRDGTLRRAFGLGERGCVSASESV